MGQFLQTVHDVEKLNMAEQQVDLEAVCASVPEFLRFVTQARLVTFRVRCLVFLS